MVEVCSSSQAKVARRVEALKKKKDPFFVDYVIKRKWLRC